MDGFKIEDYIPNLAAFLGVEPSTALLLVVTLVALANLGSRLIPDDATGFLGLVRKLCKIIGLYASNRIASGLTVNEVARTTVPIIEQVGDQLDKVESVVGVVKAFPGLPDRGPDGKFLKKES